MQHFRSWAGILAVPALFLFLTQAAIAEVSGVDMHARLAAAPWADSRGYAFIDDPDKRAGAIARDLRVDAELAGRLLEDEDFVPPGWIENRLEERRGELREQAAFHTALEKISPKPGELERVIEERRLRRTIPPHYNFFYLLLEVPRDASEEERAAKASLAGELAARTTPENFADMARLWSDAPSATRGGHMRSMPLERIGPTFSEALMATEPGTIGGPYELPSGIALIWVQSVSEARPFLPEDRVEDTARQFLAHEWLEERRATAGAAEQFREECDLDNHPIVREELDAYRNFMLASLYLEKAVEEEGHVPTDEELRPIHERQERLYERRFRYLARELVLTSEDWGVEAAPAAWHSRRQVRDRARELRQEILGGLPFGEAARKHSVASTAGDGGRLGWIEPPTDATLDRALATLEPGEVSVPLQRRDGYALIFLEDRAQQEPPSFEDLRPWLESRWRARRARELREEIAAGLSV